jgi:hypothetical protein
VRALPTRSTTSSCSAIGKSGRSPTAHPVNAAGVPRSHRIRARTKADGRRLYVYDKGFERDYLVQDGQKYGCSWWWTWTQPQAHDGRSSRAAFVGSRGDVKGYGRVDLARHGVRPAIICG